MTIRLLGVGDIHLGRRPRRMPEAIEAAFSSHELSPSGAWRRTVDFALAESVDAVLLAGDVVDREDDFFEAYGHLEHGVRRLADAGIPVVGVAGNHDVQVLPRLAKAIPEFRLLGEGGTWEACQIRSRAVPTGSAAQAFHSLQVVGWSFPAPRVTTSPVLDLRSGRTLDAGSESSPDGQRAAGPSIGLLHCDRDRAGSEHAPVASRDLDAAPVDAWLLGHIHIPDQLDGDRPIGYLGSLVGLDPTETGPHGPWLVEVEHGAKVRARQVPLAPLRWERLTVRCDDIGTVPLGDTDIAQWIDSALLQALHDLADGLSARAYANHKPAVLGCRITIVGRTGRGEELLTYLDRANTHELWYDCEGVSCFVDRVDVRTQPEVSVEDLARGRDPVGLLAAKLLVLDRPRDDPERQALIDAARLGVNDVHASAQYRVLSDVRTDVNPADDEAWIVAEDEAQIVAEDEAQIVAEDEAQIVAEDEAQIVAEDEAQIVAEDEAQIVAEDEAQIVAGDEAQIVTLLRQSAHRGLESLLAQQAQQAHQANDPGSPTVDS